MSLQQYLRILRRQWFIIAAVALAGFAVAVGFSMLATPTYTATSSVYFSLQSAKTGSDLSQGTTFARDQMDSYAALADQPVVLAPVIEELGLAATAKQLAAQVEATPTPGTVLLKIQVDDADPSQAARIANSTATHLGAAARDLAPKSGGEAAIAPRTVAEATPPAFATSPNTRRNAATGLAAGLLLSVALALARETLDSRVRSSGAVRETTDVPVIGEIPPGRTPTAQARVVFAESRSADAEAYRRLSANLKASAPVEHPTVAITSAETGEGKSVTAINLAVAAAESGLRVLLIDADLRNPAIAAYTGLPDRRGLSEVLTGRAPFTQLVQPLILDALDVLTSGTRPQRPGELLDSRAMRTLLDDARSSYDLVLIDTPAVLSVTDPLMVAPAVSGTIVVASAARLRRPQLRQAISGLQHVDAHLLGVVLNQVRPSRRTGVPWAWWQRMTRRAAPGREAVEPLLTTHAVRGFDPPELADDPGVLDDESAVEETSGTIARLPARDGSEESTPYRRRRARR